MLSRIRAIAQNCMSVLVAVGYALFAAILLGAMTVSFLAVLGYAWLLVYRDDSITRFKKWRMQRIAQSTQMP